MLREILERSPHYADNCTRYTSYPPVSRWGAEIDGAAYADALRGANQSEPIRLYVHLPFCDRRCWFCACNVTIRPPGASNAPYLDRLTAEMATVGALVKGRHVDSLHLGGGTPNSLPPADVAHLFSALWQYFAVDARTIVDCEMDPRVATAASVAAFAATGVRRISFGVQDIDPEVGRAIGRELSLGALVGHVQTARRFGVRSVNFDLMYGLPRQTPESIDRTIVELLSIRPERVALFGYAHMPSVRPQQRRLEASGLPDASERAALYVAAATRLCAAGYAPIGLDHFAVPADEMARAAALGTLRRTFQGYTTHGDLDEIGLGASAISDIRSGPLPVFAQNVTSEKVYRATPGLPITRGIRLTADDVARGRVIEAITCRLAVREAGLWRRYPEARARLGRFEQDGLVLLEADKCVCGDVSNRNKIILHMRI